MITYKSLNLLVAADLGRAWVTVHTDKGMRTYNKITPATYQRLNDLFYRNRKHTTPTVINKAVSLRLMRLED